MKANIKTTQSVSDTRDLHKENEQLRTELSDLRNRLKAVQLVLSSLSEAVIVNDSSGATWFANKAAIEILGFDPAGLDQRKLIEKLKDCADEQKKDAPGLPFFQAMQGKTILDEIYRVTDETGKLRHFSVFTTPVEDKNELVGSIIIGSEETEQLELLQRMEQKRAALQAVINSAPEAMIVVDEKARIVMINPVAEKLLNGPVKYRTPLSDLPLFRERDLPFPA